MGLVSLAPLELPLGFAPVSSYQNRVEGSGNFLTSKARFFSHVLLGQWFALLRKDKYSLLDSIVERRAMGSVTYTVTIEDLSKMQEIAESEYVACLLYTSDAADE